MPLYNMQILFHVFTCYLNDTVYPRAAYDGSGGLSFDDLHAVAHPEVRLLTRNVLPSSPVAAVLLRCCTAGAAAC